MDSAKSNVSKDNTLLNYFSPENGLKPKLSTNNNNSDMSSKSLNTSSQKSNVKCPSETKMQKKHKQKQLFKSDKDPVKNPMSAKNKKLKISSEKMPVLKTPDSSSSNESESECDSSSSDDDDNQPIKYLIEKNNIRDVNVVVRALSPEKLVTSSSVKRKSFELLTKSKPDSDSNVKRIEIIDLSSSDSDEEVEPKKAKKSSPSSSTSSGVENKRIGQSPKKKPPPSSPMRKFLSGKSAGASKSAENSKTSRTPTSSLNYKEKFTLLKKNSHQNNFSLPKLAKKVHQKQKPKRSSSVSSIEDALPLSQVSKILATKSNNSTPGNSTPPKLKSKKPSTPNSSNKFLDPEKMRAKRFKFVLSRLEQLKSAANNSPSERRAYTKYALHVVRSALLSSDEINTIVDETIKNDLTERVEKEKVKTMSDDERKAYFRQKYVNDYEKRRKISMLERERFEDSEFVFQKPGIPSLPNPKPVIMFGNLPSTCYGDVLMITEFLLTYADFLKRSPVWFDEKLNVKPETLMKALTSGHSGFELLTKIMVVLLNSLLQEIGPIELSFNIDDIELNIYTVTELARITLRKTDMKLSLYGDQQDVNETYDDEISSKLLHLNIYDLVPENILQILNALVHRLLQTKVLEDFVYDKEDELSAAVKQRIEAANDLKQHFKTSKNEVTKVKTADRESTPSSVGGDSVKHSGSPAVNALSSTHFYGKNVAATESESNENKQIVTPAATTSTTSDSTVIDDMIYKVKNRRALTEQEKEKRKLEEEILKKEHELASKRSRVDTATNRVGRLQRLCKFIVRLEPLGMDRFHNRYWYFPKSSPNLFVEKGWSTGFDQVAASLASPKKFKSLPPVETTFPNLEDNTWWYYDSLEQVDVLISSMLAKGIRESRLFENLKRIRDNFASTIEKYEKTSKIENKFLDSDGEVMLVEFLREQILIIQCDISAGGLGGSDNIDDFRERLENAKNLNEFGELLIETQQSVRPTLLKGMMAVKKSLYKEAEDDEKNEEEGDNDKDEEDEEKSAEYREKQEEVKRTKRLESWLDAVRTCQTWSRMIVLVCMFKKCIMWEKSVDKARCNKCRKDKDDNKMILCEVCNTGYHIYCLKPPLKKIPAGDWFCNECKPPFARTRNRTKVGQEESEPEEERDDACALCNEGSNISNGDLVPCSTCPSAFHQACHEPPLKYAPRPGWRCCQCTKGIVIKRRSRRRGGK